MKRTLVILLFASGFALNASAAGIVSAIPTGSDPYAIPTWSGTMITGQLFDRARIQGGGSGRFTNANYTVPSFGQNAASHSDRRQQYVGYGVTLGGVSDPNNIPGYLLGLDYVMTMNDNRNNNPFQIDITTTGAGRAYLFVDTRIGNGVDQTAPSLGNSGANLTQWVLDNGWAPMITGAKPSDYLGSGDIIGLSASPNNVPNIGPDVFTGTVNQYSEVWYKDITGNSYSLFTMGESYNYFGTAFAPIPEPGIMALAALGFSALLIRRRS